MPRNKYWPYLTYTLIQSTRLNILIYTYSHSNQGTRVCFINKKKNIIDKFVQLKYYLLFILFIDIIILSYTFRSNRSCTMLLMTKLNMPLNLPVLYSNKYKICKILIYKNLVVLILQKIQLFYLHYIIYNYIT